MGFADHTLASSKGIPFLMEIDCPYCGYPAGLIDSIEIFSQSYGMVWACRPCNAWVGVHKNDGKNRPLGTLADADTRHARKMAHKRFDPIWQSRLGKGKAKWKVRSAVYKWLAGHLEIPVEQCHIAMFDLVTCVKVIEICTREVYGPV
jgi:uncharacterized protein DUF3268